MTRQELALIAQTRAQLADGSARLRRTAARVRLVEFAAAVGRTPAALSQWERGIREPGARDALAYGRQLAALERKAA